MATAFKNVTDNAASTTATSLAATGVTSITVATGDGAKFPTAPFFVTLWTGLSTSDPASDANMEKVTCTNRVGDVLTISATTKTHSATVNVACLMTAQQIIDLQTAVNAIENATNASSFIQNEVPAGLVNSSNTAYTTASNMATGSLRVYRNGIRLKGGGVDFTQGANNAFTMVTAPVTGDTLLVDYNVSATGFSVGTNSTISTQAPTGSVNGSNTSFTVAQGVYIAGSLEVYIDGIHQVRGVDYTETTPASGIFTMTTAPYTGQTIYCNYQFNLNPSSNTDTVDGIHASATGGQSGMLVADDGGGWLLGAGTFTYASATTITTPTNMSGYLAVGDKLRLVQTTTKYFYIVGITSTTITITGGSDYTLVNAAISNVYYSKQLTPFGFPQWFNYAETYTGFSVAPTGGYCRFKIDGRTVTMAFNRNTGTSNATTYTMSLPATAANPAAGTSFRTGNISLTDNGVTQAASGLVDIPVNTASVGFYKDNLATGWTASGQKGARGHLFYEI